MHTTSEALQSGGSTVFFGCSSGGGELSPPPQAAAATATNRLASIRNIGAACALVPALSILPTGEAAAQDRWTGQDKALHLGGEAAVGLLATGFTTSAGKAWGGCMVVGLTKEAVDAAGYGRASFKDLVADAAGCTLGVAGGRLLVHANGGRVQAAYTWELK